MSIKGLILFSQTSYAQLYNGQFNQTILLIDMLIGIHKLFYFLHGLGGIDEKHW
jgi:hypothetical protein